MQVTTPESSSCPSRLPLTSAKASGTSGQARFACTLQLPAAHLTASTTSAQVGCPSKFLLKAPIPSSYADHPQRAAPQTGHIKTCQPDAHKRPKPTLNLASSAVGQHDRPEALMRAPHFQRCRPCSLALVSPWLDPTVACLGEVGAVLMLPLASEEKMRRTTPVSPSPCKP